MQITLKAGIARVRTTKSNALVGVYRERLPFPGS